MSFRKKVLYYGLMLLLTLPAIEGMARLAYYAAYGTGYGGGRSDAATTFTPPPPNFNPPRPEPLWINHPFYGHARNGPDHALNGMPPVPRREDTVVIGLLGGSVAAAVKPFLEQELRRWFAANNLPRPPVVLELAAAAQQQPQQVIIVANTLLLGGEFDLIINLDGFNEVALGPDYALSRDAFPLFPMKWKNQVLLTAEGRLRAGQIGALRREQARLMAAGETAILRWSAVFGLVNRYRRERIAAAIIQRNHELAAVKSRYTLEKHGPRTWLEKEERLLPAAARVWYRGSLTLARLSELSGAEYYHFLQPNQYVPGSKPLSPEERELSSPYWGPSLLTVRGYPLLRQFSRDLQRRGVNSFDLTGIFADRRETLYRDKCCHLNDRGNELLAAAMVQRMAPALRHLGRESPAAPVSALAAARRPARPDTRLLDAAFQVYLQGDGRWLRYGRADCAAAEVATRFFLHLTPRDLADLPPYRREHGFDNRDFSFAEAGGFLYRGQCQAQIRLPDYPIAALRTGQYAADAGELWVAEYAFPE